MSAAECKADLGRVAPKIDRNRAHGYKQAFVVKPAECHACRVCVDACPERAIRLVPLRS